MRYKSTKNRWNKQKSNNKIIDLKIPKSEITSNVKLLNILKDKDYELY